MLAESTPLLTRHCDLEVQKRKLNAGTAARTNDSSIREDEERNVRAECTEHQATRHHDAAENRDGSRTEVHDAGTEHGTWGETEKQDANRGKISNQSSNYTIPSHTQPHHTKLLVSDLTWLMKPDSHSVFKSLQNLSISLCQLGQLHSQKKAICTFVGPITCHWVSTLAICKYAFLGTEMESEKHFCTIGGYIHIICTLGNKTVSGLSPFF